MQKCCRRGVQWSSCLQVSLCVQEFTTFDGAKNGGRTLLQKASGMCITRKTIGYNVSECGLFCRFTVGFLFYFSIPFLFQHFLQAANERAL